MKDQQIIRSIIVLFLQVNPEPADAQVHALAESLGIDHETLEAEIYQMLGEHERENVRQQAARLRAAAQDELTLQGEQDMAVAPAKDMTMNDGAPAGTSSDQLLQDDTYTDGPGPEDRGLDLGVQPETYDDGYLAAATRLVAEV